MRNLYLSPDKSRFKSFSKEVFGFDIETYSKKNHFLLACLNFEEETKTYFKKEHVKYFLNDRPKIKNKIGVATNLGFDFLGTLIEYRDFWKVSERKGTIYSFTWYCRKNKRFPIRFYDTVNFFQASVKKLGKIVNIPKLPHPKCFTKKPKTETQLEELIKYCENDAEISRVFFNNFIVKFANDNKVKLKSTIASTSLADFRRNYLNKWYKVEPIEIHNKIFKAYYGGRTEVFKRGTFKNVNCYDINSLYPSVMVKKLPNPNSFIDISSSSQYHIDHYEGVSYVEGFQEERYIPILPVRFKDKLVFPCGIIKGFYTHIELREAQKNGFNVKYIGSGVIYTKECTIFKRFVESKYKTRKYQKSNKDPMEIMTKLTMNSLYGKFAFNYRESNSLIPVNDLSPKQVENATYIEDLGNGFISLSSSSDLPTNYSFPIFSCYITAHARLKIWREMEKVKENLVYCDTDSMFLNDNKTIDSSDVLGEFKHEYFKEEAIFVKPKMYFTEYAKVKGVSSIKTEKQFKDLMINPTINEERFIKYRSVMRSKEHHKNGVLKINEIINITKKLSLEDEKRQWESKFNYKIMEESKPLTLKESDYEEVLGESKEDFRK